ncbi:sialate O-acetylesterase [Pontiellaceae bacterium B12227]|nr:sialate O-acetylesterase [Pontiellaceae bacterium B12227]
MMNKPTLSKNCFKSFFLSAALVLGAVSAQAALFDFNNGTGLDNVGVGGTMTADDVVTIVTTSDVRGHDGTLDSDGNSHETNITSSNALGVNSASTPPNAASDARDFDPGEAWIFSFNTNVVLNSIDLASLDTDAVMTISSPAFTTIVINDDGGSEDVYSLGDVLVGAGTLITFENSSATSTTNNSHDFRISTLTVTPTDTPVTNSTATFDFVDESEFDNPAAVGSTMTRNNITITTIDLIGQDGSLNSTGATHKLNIFTGLDALAVNDGNVSGTEYKDFNPGEGWVMSFDQNVNLVELNMYGQDAGAEMTVSSSAFSDFVLVDGVNSEDIHSFNDTYVAAGTEITFLMTSATNAADLGLSISSITVELATNAPSLPTETINGTPYVWLDQFFQGLESEEDYLNADNSDTDGDLMAAWEEYFAGTIPTNAASVLIVNTTGVALSDGVVSWQSVTGKCYGVMSNTNLVAVSNGWKTVANNIQGLENATSYTSTVSSAAAAFFKVGIEKREIYLLIGQSNMAGRGPIEAQDEGVIEGCELFNFGEEWEPATNPLNQYSTIRKDLDLQQLNPGYGFAKRLNELRSEINIGLVVNARGGTNINDWEKGDLYYEQAVARTRAALADGNSRLAGILWHQGESNSSQTNTYMGKLVLMIENLRADLGAPDLPFVIGELERDDVTVEVKERLLNEVLYTLPTLSSNTAVATTEGLVTLDGTHFDSAGQRELGRRYADALLSLE